MNNRLRVTLHSNGFTYAKFGEEIGVDPKTVERWTTKSRTPHRRTANMAAKLLGVPVTYLWPELDTAKQEGSEGGVVNFYAHRSEVPNQLWLDKVIAATERIEFLTYASLFFSEDNPEGVNLIRHKAANGVQVRFMLGDPVSSSIEMRSGEESIPIRERIEMALAYYRPLIGAPGVSFHLHSTTLYNSIYRFDDEMLVNQHAYGTYGYVAPILHVRKVPTSRLFETYETSFEKVWDLSTPFESVDGDRA